MSYFGKAILSVLEHEGGYTHNPNDPGGETNFGICKRSYPDLDIKYLTKDEAIEIYKRDYWRGYYDKFNDYRVAAKVFDMSVNMGHKRSHKLLQRSLDLVEDGVIGEQTLKAANSQNGSVVVQGICKAQQQFYDMLIKSNPALATFKKGWSRRAAWIPDGIA
jgi:lysozyme family protein